MLNKEVRENHCEIEILNHIEKYQDPRLLSETEYANGFSYSDENGYHFLLPILEK
jgi:hypothetical protein